MRRKLLSALAVPVLLLSACGSDDEPEVVDAPGASEDDAEEPAEDDSMATTEDDSMATTEDDSMETSAPDDSMETSAPGSASGESEGTPEEQQAAADRTKEWLVAFVNGDPEVCNYMLDFTSEGPMADSEADLEQCETLIPSMASDMFDSEIVGIIESIEINGSTITGDTAVVGRDNFSDMFAEGFGDQEFTLKNVDGEWYFDLNALNM